MIGYFARSRADCDVFCASARRALRSASLTEPLLRSGMDCTATLVSARWMSPHAPVNGVATDLLCALRIGASEVCDFSEAAASAFTGKLPKVLKYSSC